MQIVDGRRYPTVTSEGIYGFFHQYRWLSNFHVCRVTVQGTTYPSSEHAYMAMKTLKIMDRRKLAREIETPAQAKAFGQTVKLRPNWEEIKYSKMLEVLRCKFIQNKDLRIMLQKTRDLYLEETNNWGDVYWGVCNGEGKNKLGQALMRVRRELFE